MRQILIVLTFLICPSLFSENEDYIYRVDLILFKFLPNLNTNEEFDLPDFNFVEDLKTLSSMSYPEFIEPMSLDLNYDYSELFIEVDSPAMTVDENLESDSVVKPKNRDFFELDIGEEFSLLTEVKALQKSRDYRVIGHFSWFQQVVEEGLSSPLLIDTEIFKENKIFGTLNVYKKRFLHSDFNFYLAEKTEELDVQELKVKLNKENNEEYEILTKEDSMRVTYQLTQSRKLKSGELHHIDHPKFGIIYRLVKAEKIEQS